MLLAERAGRELEPPSNLGPRGMTVIAAGLVRQRNRIRPIGLLHFFPSLQLAGHLKIRQLVSGEALSF